MRVWVLRLLVLWLLSAHLTSQGVNQTEKDYVCPQYWSFLTVTGEIPTPGFFCYSLVNPMTFQEASAHCLAQRAEMLTLDADKSYSTRSKTNFTEFLASYGVDRLWHSYYVYDRQLQTYFPLVLGERPARGFLLTEMFRTDEVTGTSSCFEVFLNLTATDCDDQPAAKRRKRAADSALSAITDGFLDADLCTDFSTQLSSTPCQDKLPFVCVKPALRKVVSPLQALPVLCQQGEVGNYELGRCIRFGNGSVSFASAKSKCEARSQNQRRPHTLYRPLAKSSAYLNGFVTDIIRKAFPDSQGVTRVSTNALAWVDQPLNSEKNECVALVLDPAIRRTVSWDCSARLPFYVCQHNLDLPVPSKIVLSLENIPDSVTTKIPGTKDMQVSIPYMSTVRQSLPIVNQERPISPAARCTYYGYVVPGLQTMKLVKGGRQLTQANSESTNSEGTITQILQQDEDYRFPSVSNRRSHLTDYYWCELNDLRTGQIRRSGRVFLRAQEVEMYAARVTVSQESLSIHDLFVYSITNGEVDPSGIQYELDQAFGYNIEGPYRYRLLRARPKQNSNETILDFHIFYKNVSLNSTFVPTGRGIDQFKKRLKSELQRTSNFTDFVFDVDSLVVRSIDICKGKRLEDPISGQTYNINDTKLGVSFVSPEKCPSNGEPFVNLKCQGNKLYGAYWSRFKQNDGCNFFNEPTSPVTPTLRDISESTINETTLDEIVEDTEEVVKRIDEFAPVDIVYLANIIQQIVEIPSIPVQMVDKVLGLVDTVAEADDAILKKSNLLGNATNRILKALDVLGDKVIIGDNEDNVRVVKRNTALEVWDLTRFGDADDVIIGLELQEGEDDDIDDDDDDSSEEMNTTDISSLFENDSPSYRATEAAIFLSAPFVRSVIDANPGSDVRLSMTVFVDTKLFRLSGRDPNVRGALNSKVISARVSVDGQAVTELAADYMVNTVFKPTNVPQVPASGKNVTCVFWDYLAAQGQGAWSKEGCRYIGMQEGTDVCVCDHLTNFAVLLDFYGQSALAQEHQKALSIITIVGLSLSIVGLSITVLSFILIRKLRKGLPQQTLFNMALAMLASWITFLAGFTRTEDHAACVAVAALLHYFILASFMWMLMEGILQYLLFVKVLGNDFDNYMVKTAIPAWGLPLIPVIIVLAIDTDLYRGGEQYCWMSLTPFYYAFVGPVVLVMVVNIVVYVMVTVNITRRSKVTSSDSNRKAVGIRASVACFVVLGLSWVFAFFAVEDARVVFQYLFTITTTLQGFLIFLIFTLRDPKVREYWRNLFCRRGRAKKASTSATPSGAGTAGGKAHGKFRKPDSDSGYGGGPRDTSTDNSGTDSRTTPPTSSASLATSGARFRNEFSNPVYD